MTHEEAIEWIVKLISTMKEDTRGMWADPQYKDEVYEAFDEAIKAVDIKERLDAYMQKLRNEHAKGDLAYLTGEIIDEISQEVYGE